MINTLDGEQMKISRQLLLASILVFPVCIFGMINLTRAAEETVTYAYDQLDRLVRVEYVGKGSIIYRYDQAGDIIRLSILITGSTIIDTDQDGIADDWEMAYFNNLTSASALSDADGDKYSDLWEYLNGKNGILDSSVNPFDPMVPNRPGSPGYRVGLQSGRFWLLVLPAILGNTGR